MRVLVHGLCKFLLQQHDDLFHVLARHHLQSNVQRLPAHINVRTRQHPQDLHSQVVKYTLILLPQLVDLLQDDKFDIVVRDLDAKVDKLGGCGFDCHRVVGQGSQACCSLVDDGV